MKTKISSTVFGGAFKAISSEAVIDFQKNEIVLPDGVNIKIDKIASPLYKLRGEKFFKRIGLLFFLPIGFAAILLFWSLNLLIAGDVNVVLKIFLLISPLSVFYYSYETISAAEQRAWKKDIKKKVLLMIPFGILMVGILSSLFLSVPGFAVSALFFSAMAAFFIEEYVINDLKWIMSEGVTFWKPSLLNAPDHEKKNRYQNIEKFLLVIDEKTSEKNINLEGGKNVY